MQVTGAQGKVRLGSENGDEERRQGYERMAMRDDVAGDSPEDPFNEGNGTE